MADWLQLSPDETVIYRSRQTAKGALRFAIIAALATAIAWPMGEASVAFFFDDIDRLLTWPHVVGSVTRALVAAVIVFFLAYNEEYVVTNHRVVNRHGPVLKVFMRTLEMRLRDIAEIKSWARAQKRGKFRLISTAGKSIAVTFVPDLDGLRRTLVRETGLPDPFSG